MKQDYQEILVSREGGVVTVTLNRPHRLNATTWRMNAEVRNALAAADADEDVGAIVITGAGKAFCAGADISGSAFLKFDEEQAERERVTAQLVPPGTKEFWDLNTPLIAAINGTAVGVGITMPLHCDIRIVAEDAKLAFLFVKIGVVPERNSPWILPRLIGVSRAMDLLLTGRSFTGREAVDMGLASQCLPADQVLARAQALARDIAEGTSRVAVGVTKQLVYQALDSTDHKAFEQKVTELFRWSTRQVDGREGPKAALAKRKPDFQMRKNRDFPRDMLDI